MSPNGTKASLFQATTFSMTTCHSRTRTGSTVRSAIAASTLRCLRVFAQMARLWSWTILRDHVWSRLEPMISAMVSMIQSSAWFVTTMALSKEIWSQVKKSGSLASAAITQDRTNKTSMERMILSSKKWSLLITTLHYEQLESVVKTQKERLLLQVTNEDWKLCK